MAGAENHSLGKENSHFLFVRQEKDNEFKNLDFQIIDIKKNPNFLFC
jgi:hypothetical protein